MATATATRPKRKAKARRKDFTKRHPRRAPSQRVPSKCLKIIRAIPGYDPVATAGDCTFDAQAAQLALDFYSECLTHVKGDLASQPLELAIWEQAIVANTFGWKRPDGTRRYREVMVFVPRKNGKTTLGAGIGEYMLFCDGEPGAEIYSAAADRQQAAIVFDVATGMIRNSEVLSKRCYIYGGGPTGQSKAIVLKDNCGFWKVLSADAKTKHGFNAHAIVIDELHAQPNRDLVDVLVTSTGTRSQPLILYLTTSDYHRESVCNEKYDYATKVRDGIVEDASFLPVIHEATPDDDWRHKKTWRKANPNYGVSVRPDYIEREFRRAVETPAYENTFKRLHLNIRTEQDVRWLPIDLWDACAEPPADLDGQECWAGLDMSSTTDLSAFVLWFPGAGAVLPFAWVPEANAHERERRDRVPYLTWARQGLIEMTPGNVIDYDLIRARINSLSEQFEIKQIALDRWNSTQLMTQLAGDGFDMVPFGQGFKSMSAPTKELEKLLLSNALRHGGHPVLRWCASNVTVTKDPADNWKPDKAKSTERIDLIVALIMAIGQAMQRDESAGQSVYDDPSYGL